MSSYFLYRPGGRATCALVGTVLLLLLLLLSSCLTKIGCRAGRKGGVGRGKKIEAMKQLLSLPSDVLAYELLPFLSTTDICRMDMAVTNQQLRPQLIDSFRSLSLKHAPDGLTRTQMRWFCNRHIVLEKIVIAEGLSQEEILDIFHMLKSYASISKVRHFDFTHCLENANPLKFPGLLQNCAELLSFCISGYPLTNAMLSRLGKQCPGLVSLNLFNTKVKAEGFISLTHQCSSLESLNISHCSEISTKMLTGLGIRCRLLSSLDLSNTTVTDEAISSLVFDCQTLIELKLKHCHEITDVAVIAVAECCSLLTSLNLRDNDNISDRAVITLAHHCPSLTNLDISYCAIMTDAAVIAVAKNCPGMADLVSCLNITDAAIFALAQNCLALKSVDLCHCREISNAAIKTLVQNNAGLTSINLSGCKMITDAAVITIAQHCPKLKILKLCFCDQITDAAVITLARSCPLLTELTFASLVNITESSFEALAKFCPKLSKVKIGRRGPLFLKAARKHLARGCCPNAHVYGW